MRMRFAMALSIMGMVGCSGLNPLTVGEADLDDSARSGLSCPRLQYPSNALQNHERGTALVRVTAGRDGTVVATELIVPTASTYLNDAAVSAANACRWQPSGPDQSHSVNVTVVWDLIGEKPPRGVVRIGIQPSKQ